MSGIGSAEVTKFQAGKRLTQRQAIRAKCCECNGGYQDTEARADCCVESCPLHPMMPYVVVAQRKAVKTERAAVGGTSTLNAGLTAWQQKKRNEKTASSPAEDGRGEGRLDGDPVA